MPILYTFFHSPTYSTGTSHYIALFYTPTTTGGAVAVNIYRSTTNGGPYVLIETMPISEGNDYFDYNVQQGVTYYYVFTEIDGLGGESAQSAQFQGTVQVG